MEQVGNVFLFNLVERHPAKCWTDVNTKEHFVNMPAAFVSLDVRQVALTSKRGEGRNSPQFDALLLWV